MTKKYSLTSETRTHFGVILFRVKAEITFNANGETVHAGDLGGFIENESNLSHTENAWVLGDALVCGNAQVYRNAQVSENARVQGDARVYVDENGTPEEKSEYKEFIV